MEAAQKEMLEYTKFDREPFPDLYDMLAGKKSGADVLAGAEKKGLKDNALVMFFAHYYVGLNEQLLGKPEAAAEHLAKAVKLAQEAGASGGPAIWDRWRDCTTKRAPRPSRRRLKRSRVSTPIAPAGLAITHIFSQKTRGIAGAE